MATHRLLIPKWRPCPLNQLLYARIKVRIRLKKLDRAMLGTYFLNAGIPKATGKRRLSLCIRLGPRQREVDIDAFLKSTLDAAVHCGALRGDTGQWAEWGGVTYERGTAEDWGTTVVLEDREEDTNP